MHIYSLSTVFRILHKTRSFKRNFTSHIPRNVEYITTLVICVKSKYVLHVALITANYYSSLCNVFLIFIICLY